MKIKTSKISAIFIISVIALASIGTGYALLSENLYFDGTVDTGELNWEFTSVLHLDPGPPSSIPDYHCNPGFTGNPPNWMGDKDVGYTVATVADPHTVTIDLYNVYPCYFNMIALYFKAKGTIPFRIQDVTFSSPYDEVVLVSNGIFDLDLDGDTNPDIEFWWRDDFFGDQYHPDDDVDETSFWLHVIQPAPQGETLSFTVAIRAVQWNEYVPI